MVELNYYIGPYRYTTEAPLGFLNPLTQKLLWIFFLEPSVLVENRSLKRMMRFPFHVKGAFPYPVFFNKGPFSSTVCRETDGGDGGWGGGGAYVNRHQRPLLSTHSSLTLYTFTKDKKQPFVRQERKNSMQLSRNTIFPP